MFLFILNFYDLLCDYLTDAGNSYIKKKIRISVDSFRGLCFSHLSSQRTAKDTTVIIFQKFHLNSHQFHSSVSAQTL